MPLDVARLSPAYRSSHTAMTSVSTCLRGADSGVSMLPTSRNTSFVAPIAPTLRRPRATGCRQHLGRRLHLGVIPRPRRQFRPRAHQHHRLPFDRLVVASPGWLDSHQHLSAGRRTSHPLSSRSPFSPPSPRTSEGALTGVAGLTERLLVLEIQLSCVVLGWRAFRRA
jgi:hypothetical protein